jgi:hypothetical protein
LDPLASSRRSYRERVAFRVGPCSGMRVLFIAVRALGGWVSECESEDCAGWRSVSFVAHRHRQSQGFTLALLSRFPPLQEREIVHEFDIETMMLLWFGLVFSFLVSALTGHLTWQQIQCIRTNTTTLESWILKDVNEARASRKLVCNQREIPQRPTSGCVSLMLRWWFFFSRMK